MRYIDADIAKEKLKEYCVDDDNTVQYWYDLMGIDDCIDKIIPTADVVEVVRCKDCEYWDDHERCDFWSSIMSPHYPEKNDYCSYGERAEA